MGLTKMLPNCLIQEAGVCLLYLEIKPVRFYRKCGSIEVLAAEGSTQVSRMDFGVEQSFC